MDINIQTLLIDSESAVFFKDYQAFFGVLIASFLGYQLYRVKEEESRLKSEASNFVLLLFYIKTNLEEIHAIWKLHVQPAVKELNIYLNELIKIKELGDLYHGKRTIGIPFIDEAHLKNYILQKAYHSIDIEKLTLKYTYIKVINEIKEKDLEEKTLFFVNYENVNFQPIYKTLESYYKRINTLILSLNQCIDKIQTQERNFENFICDLSDPSYEVKIEAEKQKILFFKNLYEALLRILEFSLLYSDIAIDHLNAFNYHYSKKYKRVLQRIGIKIAKLNYIENTIYEMKDLTFIQKDLEKLCSKPLWEIPLYNCLKLNFIDNFLNHVKKEKKYVPNKRT